MIPRKVERNLSGLATYGKNIDLFVDKQPPMKFVEELTRPMHEVKPTDFGKKRCKRSSFKRYVSGYMF